MAIYALDFLVSVGVIGIAVATLVVALHRFPGLVAFVKGDHEAAQVKHKPITAGLLILASLLALVVVAIRCGTYLTLERNPGMMAITILHTCSLVMFGLASSTSKAVASFRAYRLTTNVQTQVSTSAGLILSALALLSSIAAGTLFAIPSIKVSIARDVTFLTLSLLLTTLVVLRVAECLVGLCRFGIWRTTLLTAVDAIITTSCICALALAGFNRTFFFMTNVGAAWNALVLSWETDAQEDALAVRLSRVRASSESFGSSSTNVGAVGLEDGDVKTLMDEKRMSVASTADSIQSLMKVHSFITGFPVSILPMDDVDEADYDSTSELARRTEVEKDQVGSTLSPITPLHVTLRQSNTLAVSQPMLRSSSKKGRHNGTGVSTRASRASSRMSEISRYSEESTFFEPNPKNLPPPIYLARHKRFQSSVTSVPPTQQQEQKPSATSVKVNYSRPIRTQP